MLKWVAPLGLAVRLIKAKMTLGHFSDLKGPEPPVCPGYVAERWGSL